MGLSEAALALLLFLSVLIANTQQQQEKDTITPDTPINETGSLVSPLGYFRLGFFTPGSSKNRYLGLWYNNIAIQTVVWVANRQHPIPPESSTTGKGVQLRLDSNGTLLLTNDNGTVVYWYTNSTSSTTTTPVARLLDNGNLQVIHSGNTILWQSFDYPSDTLLPGMKMSYDQRTGLDRRLTGWSSPDDPSPGDFSMGMDVRGVPQVILTATGDRPIWRTGPWTGERFSGIPEMRSYSMFNFSFVSNPGRETSYQFTTSNASIISRLIVNTSGITQRLVWVPRTGHTGVWNAFWFAPKDQCDSVSPCGPYGVCDPNDAPICSCLQGFRPKTPEDWALRDGTDGCVRTTPKDCANGTDGFVVVNGAKLPDTSNAMLVGKGVMGLDQCRAECLRNCSCTAYAAADITAVYGQSGCIIWTSELTDLRVFGIGGQDLYVRLAARDLGSSGSTHSTKVRLVVILVSVLLGVVLLGWLTWAWRRRNRKRIREIPRATISKSEHSNYNRNYNADHSDGVMDDLDLPLFEFRAVLVATDYFSDHNKLGEGGFGPVYKGKLEDGQDVAIKRLARNSVQGVDEFKNEVMLIAKLQHRNLVRLLGCCIQGEERMLIYEYMSNRSLDAVLFDKEKGASLDWNARYKITVGIARGLLYLHQDSRFRIIHRDLKASNILLDKDMTPKISDFGMARIFGGDETEANTRRVVGTYGYMSPEYAMDGIFSIKSDVFSFGVLVLEIISGMKNRGVFHAQPQQNLLGHVWRLWKEGSTMELVDKSVGESCSAFEVNKCLKIGLLCVQEHPEDRPTMSSVVLMLGSDNALLPQPKQPGFTIARGPFETSSSTSGMRDSGSVNDMSVTMFQGR